MQPPNLQRSNASKGNTWNATRPSAAKATTSAAQARKVALLCCHYLDRLRVLAMASVVRLNGGTIDQMANPFPSSEPAWGLRAYLILIGCAAERQTVTYDALARRIKRRAILSFEPFGLPSVAIRAVRKRMSQTMMLTLKRAFAAVILVASLSAAVTSRLKTDN